MVAALVEKKAGIEHDLTAAYERVGPALKEKDTSINSWTLYELVRLAKRGGKADLANRIAAHIPDAELRSRATFDPDAVSKGSDLDVLSEFAGQKPPRRHALLELARRNTRSHGSSVVSKVVNSWDSELRPLGYTGIALGMLDSEK